MRLTFEDITRSIRDDLTIHEWVPISSSAVGGCVLGAPSPTVLLCYGLRNHFSVKYLRVTGFHDVMEAHAFLAQDNHPTLQLLLS